MMPPRVLASGPKPSGGNKTNKIYIFFYISLRTTLNETLTAKFRAVLLRTP